MGKGKKDLFPPPIPLPTPAVLRAPIPEGAPSFVGRLGLLFYRGRVTLKFKVLGCWGLLGLDVRGLGETSALRVRDFEKIRWSYFGDFEKFRRSEFGTLRNFGGRTSGTLRKFGARSSGL